MSPNDKNLLNKTQEELHIGETIKNNSTTIGTVLVGAAALVGTITIVKSINRKRLKAKANRRILKNNRKK